MNINKKNRIQQVNEMLLQMGSGNLFYRIELFDKNDYLEAFSISLNMLAEEIQEKMKHEGYVNSHNPMLEILQLVVILDANGIIEMANKFAVTLFSEFSSTILGTPFDIFLDPPSQKKWKTLWKTLQHKESSDTCVELKFRSKDSLVIPKTCFITPFKDEKYRNIKTLITTIHFTTMQDYLNTKQKELLIEFTKKQMTQGRKAQKSKPRLSFEDIRKIKEGHKIIISNLEKDFPSLRDFAHQLGTNEFKLKYGFKELYHITVHRFLINERLKKAEMMLHYTDVSIKTITQKTGFKSTSHFSRTFKSHYGYTPSKFRKKILNEL